MTKEEIEKEAENYIDKAAPYWLKAEPEDRESSVEELTKFAIMILNKITSKKRLSCYCGNPIDLSNPDCVQFSLCKDCAMDV
ncbi:MAG TPA: hypothetical protein VMZ91_10530 [Candidatus Paceibacterota bacterium]|nr:hypothetical protein [Candidatus Paceibacterota bacterium]